MNLTPAQRVDVARAALKRGAAREAAAQVAAALATDPGHPDALALADVVFDATPDPLALVVPGTPPEPEVVALRARFLARLGRWPDAVDYLVHVVSIRPDAPYVAWLTDWVEREDVRAALEPARFAGTVLTAIRMLDETEDGQMYGDSVRPALLGVVRTLRHAHEDDPYLMMAHVRLGVRCGALHEALSIAQALHQSGPSFETAVMLANAHRELGRVDATVEAYRTALVHDPENVAVRLDIGDVLLLSGRFAEALDAYEGVLKREPGNRLALPSVYCLKYWMHGRPEWRDRLEALADEAAPNERAAALLDEVTPYVGFLPDPQDAIVNSARAVALQFAGPVGSATTSRVTVLEPPSAVLAYRLTVGGPHTMHVQVVPVPDPREPRCEVSWRLWDHDGTEPRRLVEAPRPEVAKRVAAIASRPFQVEDWKTRGHALGQQLGADAAGDLLAVMVWPPDPPEGVPQWRWLPHVQLAAALTLAWLDDGWAGSARRGALMSLANGPTDWTGAAALVALTEIAREEPEHAAEVAELMLEMLQTQPSTGSWCLERPLVACLLRLPGLPSELEQELRAYRARLG